MEAIIESIELVKINNKRSYFKVKLVDEQGNLIGYFGDSKLSDCINFRKQLFGILAACDCFDLLRLSSDESNFLPIYLEFDSCDRIDSIINLDGDGLSFFEDGKYVVNKYNLKNIDSSENRGKIISVTSESGVFIVTVTTEHYVTSYVTRSLYAGFRFPWDWYDSKVEPYYTNLSATMFKTFVESILQIYKTNDLLKLSRCDVIKYPKVLIGVDYKGRIVSIGNDKNDYYLTQNGNNYEIVKGSLMADIKENESLSNSRKIIKSLSKRLRKCK